MAANERTYRALVRALMSLPHPKAHARIAYCKRQLMKQCGGMTPEYVEIWNRARLAAGYLTDDAEQEEKGQ